MEEIVDQAMELVEQYVQGMITKDELENNLILSVIHQAYLKGLERGRKEAK